MSKAKSTPKKSTKKVSSDERFAWKPGEVKITPPQRKTKPLRTK